MGSSFLAAEAQSERAGAFSLSLPRQRTTGSLALAAAVHRRRRRRSSQSRRRRAKEDLAGGAAQRKAPEGPAARSAGIARLLAAAAWRRASQPPLQGLCRPRAAQRSDQLKATRSYREACAKS